MEVRVGIACTFEPRLAALGLARWRDSVNATLYHYVRAGDLVKTETAMEKYETMERLSLLELVILKSKAADGVFFRSLNEIREQ